MTAKDNTNRRGQLEGKKVLVTGASRGIGRAIAIEMAKEGADVAINYHSNDEKAQKTAEQIKAMGRKAITIKGNVSDVVCVEEMINTIVEEYGRVDVLINNAGIRRDNLLMTMMEQEWDEVLDTNLKGVYLCTKFILKHMIANRSGSIVSIASNSGVAGVAGQTNYSASKGGIIGFSKSLAREVGRFGIRVNVVAPGFIETDMVADLAPNRKKEMEKQIALRRIGKAEEVAKAVVFLVSDNASFITGHTLMVNGGDVL